MQLGNTKYDAGLTLKGNNIAFNFSSKKIQKQGFVFWPVLCKTNFCFSSLSNSVDISLPVLRFLFYKISQTFLFFFYFNSLHLPTKYLSSLWWRKAWCYLHRVSEWRCPGWFAVLVFLDTKCLIWRRKCSKLVTCDKIIFFNMFDSKLEVGLPLAFFQKCSLQ